MTLRRKVGFWSIVLIVAVAIIALMPAATKSSFSGIVKGWLGSYTTAVQNNHDDDDDDDDDVPIERLMVRIDGDISAYAGIETSVLAESSFFPESKAMAIVVDIRPLVTIKARYNQAVSALNVAKVAERSAAQELKRLNTLAKGVGSVATKKVDYARAVWREANAALQGLGFEVQAVQDDGQQSWGAEVTSWVFAKNSEQWKRLLSHQDSLLLVILPADVSLVADISFIRVTRDGTQQQARKAYFVSPAVSTGALTQGESYFFKIATGRLRARMRLDAWIPTTNTPITGVFVPDKAIIWNDGLPWVYIEKEEDLYQRRSVQQGLPATGGLFVEHGLAEGELLVIKGAQMLLSEEFRWQILDEDDDD
ncbi:MAG: hypothetical protein COA83_08095 [Methylophaga sp.]|nr:MAG: hypothetical protein COA83_08095 [Methylophaga sp.]